MSEVASGRVAPAPPITHREAIAALPAATLADLRQTSDGPGLKHLAQHVGALAVTTLLILYAGSWWVVAPAMLVQGVLLAFLFTLEHECIHETAFRARSLDLAVAEVAGFLLLLPPLWFRYFHLAHHRFTQDPARDPELATPKPTTWPGYLRMLTGWGYWRAMAGTVVRCAVGRDVGSFVPERARARVIAEARRFLLAYAAVVALGVALGWSWLLWLWILPILLGQPFLRAYLMAEHTGLPLVPDMLINSRTVFTGPLITWLAWSMPNHTAHHAVPNVPFHRLAELSRLLRPHLRSTSEGYLAFHRELQQRLH